MRVCSFRSTFLPFALAMILTCCQVVAALDLTPEERAYLIKAGTIRFVSQDSYAPFEFEKATSMDGMAIELARWIAVEAEFRAEFSSTSFKDAQEAVQEGHADVLTSLFYSQQRDEIWDFTELMYEVPAWLFVRAEREDISSIEDLRGKTVAIQEGDYAQEFIESNGLGVEYLWVRSFGEAADAVVEGAADALIGDEQIVLFHLFETGKRDQLKRIGKPLYVGSNRMAVAEGKDVLLSILNKGMAKARETGTLASISRKWIGETYSPENRSWIVRHQKQVLSLVLITTLLTLFAFLHNIRLMRIVEARTADLKKGQERFRAIANYSYSWESWIGGDDEVLWVNPAVVRVAGYTPKECLVMEAYPLSIIAEQDQERFERVVRQALADDVSHEMELMVCPKDGNPVPCEVSITPVKSSESLEGGYRIGIRNITKRQQARERLEESEKRHRLIFEAVPDSIFIVDSKSGDILDANPAACSYYGYSVSDFRMMKYSDLYADPKDIAASNKGHITSHPVCYHKTSRGMVFPTELITSSYSINNKRVSLYCVRDISKRMVAEQALARAQSLLALHIENSPLAVIEWSPDLRILRWSPKAEEIFGYSSDEVIGKTREELRLIEQEDVAGVDEVVSKLLKTHRSYDVWRNRNVCKDGEVITCDWYNSFLYDAQGELTSLLSLIIKVGGESPLPSVETG